MDGSARLATMRQHLVAAGDSEASAPERLTAADFDECIDFCDLVFAGNGGEHASRGGFAALLPQLYQPDERMAWQWAIRKRGALMSVVGVFPRTWRVMGESLKVGGIGGVGTHARLSRGSGHMRTLMNHCIETMRAGGCHMAILGGQRQRYQYYGFESAGLEVKFSVSAKNVEHSVNFGDDAAPTEQAAALTFEPLDASRMARAAELHRTRAAASSWPSECYVDRGEEFHLFLQAWLNRWGPASCCACLPSSSPAPAAAEALPAGQCRTLSTSR